MIFNGITQPNSRSIFSDKISHIYNMACTFLSGLDMIGNFAGFIYTLCDSIRFFCYLCALAMNNMFGSVAAGIVRDKRNLSRFYYITRVVEILVFYCWRV